MRHIRALPALLIAAPVLTALPAAAGDDMLAQPSVPRAHPVTALAVKREMPKPAAATTPAVKPDAERPAKATEGKAAEGRGEESRAAEGKTADDKARGPAATPAGAGLPVGTAAPDIVALRAIARREALSADVPFDLVDAVMKVESDYRPDRIGGVGEIGLMQVRPATAAMLGFAGTATDLSDPGVNIRFGTTYLAGAWRLAHGNVCRALMKYRAGHGNETMSPLSVLYCQRARAHLLAMSSPLAATILPIDLVATVPVSAKPADSLAGGIMPVRRPDSLGTTRPGESLVKDGKPKTGAAFWAAFGTRVRRINAGLEARWNRTASR